MWDINGQIVKNIEDGIGTDGSGHACLAIVNQQITVDMGCGDSVNAAGSESGVAENECFDWDLIRDAGRLPEQSVRELQRDHRWTVFGNEFDFAGGRWEHFRSKKEI